jgi:hypothetical protein
VVTHHHLNKGSIVMSQKFVRSSLALAFVLGLAGSALAAPSTRGGYRDSIRGTECAAQQVSSASYRDAQARLNLGTGSDVAAIQVAGYRSTVSHGPAARTEHQFASTAGAFCVN